MSKANVGEVKDRQVECYAVRDVRGKYGMDVEKHRMWFRASTDALCDDGIKINPEAWKKDMPTYMKNGVFLDAHDYWTTLNVIGHAVEWEVDDRGLMINYEFAVGRNPKADVIWLLYLHGDASAVSVGWRTLEYEEKQEGEGGRRYMEVTRARLLESSAVPVGMDPGALAERLMAHARAGMRMELDGVVDKYLEMRERLERPGWEDTTPDDAEKGQIRYRIKEPSLFNDQTFVILSLDVKGKKDVQIVRGKFKGDADDGKMHAQAVHFNKPEGWTMDAAKEWWKDHKEGLTKGWKMDDGTVVMALEGLEEVLELERSEEEVEVEQPGERVGKVLSAKNLGLVVGALKACEALVDALEQLKEAGDGGGEEEEGTEDEGKSEVGGEERPLESVYGIEVVNAMEGMDEEKVDRLIAELIKSKGKES